MRVSPFLYPHTHARESGSLFLREEKTKTSFSVLKKPIKSGKSDFWKARKNILKKLNYFVDTLFFG